jgi:hypothetical protein
VCTENLIWLDLVTESPNVSDDGCAVCFLLTLFASPFKSKSRLAAENAVIEAGTYVIADFICPTWERARHLVGHHLCLSIALAHLTAVRANPLLGITVTHSPQRPSYREQGCEAITCALNERGVRPARGTRWYVSSVANLLWRAQKLADIWEHTAVI